jgi:peptidoglycan/LPS O-acetylase OafA/YrhL
MKGSANLDLLRALAVTFVVASHVFVFAVGVESLPWFHRVALGHVGVAMFFVHTTLVLMQSLERHGGATLPFLVRRFFRIYPLSLATVLALAGVMAVAGQPPSLRDFISNLLLVQNLTGAPPMPTPLWTLPFEVQMYLVLPALYALTLKQQPLGRVVVVWCAALAFAVVSGEWSGKTLVSYAPCFLPGALAFVLRGRGQRSRLLLIGVIATGAMAVPVAVAYGAAETPMLWLLCAALGFTIPQCRELTARPVARVAKVVATYSYGVYVLHIFAVAFAFNGRGGIVEWVTFAILLVGFAFIAYHGIEARGVALGARIADRLAARSFTQAPLAKAHQTNENSATL